MRVKNSFFVFFLAILTFLAVQVGQAKAQEITINSLNKVTEADLAQEPPLTQKDVDIYVKYMELSFTIADLSQKESNDQIVKFLKENDVSPARFRFILEKVSVTMALLSPSEPSTDGLEAYLIPNEDEKKLVQENAEKIVALFDRR
jgi:hypothetical protein